MKASWEEMSQWSLAEWVSRSWPGEAKDGGIAGIGQSKAIPKTKEQQELHGV